MAEIAQARTIRKPNDQAHLPAALPSGVSRLIYFRNRQQTRHLHLPVLRPLVRWLMQNALSQPEFELGFFFVGTAEITRLNETFLQHAGATDVITFDYGEPGETTRIAGEIFVCIDEALTQARRFRTTWQSEVIRYLVHGVLHLRGYDDQSGAHRRIMKREENRLLSQLRRRFRFTALSLPSSRGLL